MKSDELGNVEQAVLKVLDAVDHASFPQLVNELKQQGLGERAVRSAAWGLVDRRQVNMTPDNKLTSRHTT